jgi:ABC-type multidrug transport system fused ATPase/permease subunit
MYRNRMRIQKTRNSVSAVDSADEGEVVSLFKEVLGGLASMRVYNYESHVNKEFFEKRDVTNKFKILPSALRGYHDFSMEILNAFLLIPQIILPLWLTPADQITPAFIGIVFIYCQRT